MAGGLLDAVVLPGGVGERRRPRWGARIGAVLVWTSLQALFLAPASFGAGAEYRPLVPPLLGALLNLGVGAAFLWWYVWRPAARRNRRRLATLRIRPAGDAWGWVPVVVAAIMGLAPTGLIVSARLLDPPDDRITMLERYARLPGGPLALLVTVAVIAPLFEEFLFRGWMQRTLERRLVRTAADRAAGAWRAIAITSVVFAAIHLDAFGFPLRLALAFAAGYAAWATRSIWPSVVLHGSYNAWAMALGAILPVRSTRDLARLAHDPQVLVPAALGLLVSAAVLVWGLRRMAAAVERARAAGRG